MNWYKQAQDPLQDQLEETLEESIKPTEGYHITYLSRLKNIQKRGLLLPQNMPYNWWTTGVATSRDRIHLFLDIKDAYKIANSLDLKRNRDWVLLKVIGLDPNYICEDTDFGDNWEESIRYGKTFAYSAPIPSSNIMPLHYAIGTEAERHSEFEELQ